MRQSIRALGWTVTIVTLLVFAFLATSVHSMFQTLLVDQGISIGEFKGTVSNETFVLSLVLSINNTGYYDMSELNVTTVLKDCNGTIISKGSTFVDKIAKGSKIKKLHNMSLNLIDMLSNMKYLLFQDSEFRMDVSVGLRYAYVLAFQLTMANTSISWGPPFYNFSMTGVSHNFNETHCWLDIFLSFENHSFFPINGTMYLEVYNDKGGHIGSGKRTVNVPPYSRYDGSVEVLIEKPLNYTGAGYVDVSFDVFNQTLELGRITYG